jgi:protein translocase SecG subunit
MKPLAVLQDVLAVLVMLGILLQNPKATGLGGSIGGGADAGGGYRRRRGLEASLLRFTVGVIVMFAIVSLISGFSNTH